MANAHAIDGLRRGDHVCWAFDDLSEQLDTMAQFVRTGLSRHEKVLYSAENPEPVALLRRFAAGDVPVAEALADGQLRVLDANRTYLAGGDFEPETMIASWGREIDTARREGWSGLRVAADMSWALRPAFDLDRLAWYEAQVNRAFADEFTTVVCQYDRSRFPAGRLRALAAAHPGAATPEAGPAWQPLLRMRHTAEDPRGLTLSGEIDLSNRRAVAVLLDQMIGDAATGAEPPVVDVSGVRFADVSTAHLLVDAALSSSVGLVVTGCTGTFVRLVRRTAELDGCAGILADRLRLVAAGPTW